MELADAMEENEEGKEAEEEKEEEKLGRIKYKIDYDFNTENVICPIKLYSIPLNMIDSLSYTHTQYSTDSLTDFCEFHKLHFTNLSLTLTQLLLNQ